MDSSVENSLILKKILYSLHWNRGFYWLFKIYRKLIYVHCLNRSQNFLFLDCFTFLSLNPILIWFAALCMNNMG